MLTQPCCGKLVDLTKLFDKYFANMIATDKIRVNE